ncbi:NADP oxidoreductase [Bizionia argentinensis JUB59]|uniref:NADP oxidoreductase n=1 Tax=Bizionia argentinensis JUB59 TaxID=1046627 RepID=G2EB43_9FLAO|nr:NAD(P)-binding domain-containing protein [Bizionia argentinensis]EGV44420.1 NADP oxidoreductase [Bizionia argentinensis JUB59]
MKIGIIGSGNIGGSLGKHWAKAGHEVLFSSRNPENLNTLVREAGGDAKAVSIIKAFEANADVYLLAMPFEAINDLADIYASHYADKIIIDATNPCPERDGEIAKDVRDANYNATEYTAMKFNSASTIKAFNTIKAEDLRNQAFKETDKLAIPFAAQDEESKLVGRQLIHDIGFAPLYIGSLSDTDIMDPDQAIYGKSLNREDLQYIVNATRSV